MNQGRRVNVAFEDHEDYARDVYKRKCRVRKKCRWGTSSIISSCTSVFYSFSGFVTFQKVYFGGSRALFLANQCLHFDLQCEGNIFLSLGWFKSCGGWFQSWLMIWLMLSSLRWISWHPLADSLISSDSCRVKSVQGNKEMQKNQFFFRNIAHCQQIVCTPLWKRKPKPRNHWKSTRLEISEFSFFGFFKLWLTPQYF